MMSSVRRMRRVVPARRRRLGQTMARAAPISRPKARVSVPS